MSLVRHIRPIFFFFFIYYYYKGGFLLCLKEEFQELSYDVLIATKDYHYSLTMSVVNYTAFITVVGHVRGEFTTGSLRYR